MSAAWDGVPERPEEDGWHWLRTPDGIVAPFDWRAAGECERGPWPAAWFPSPPGEWGAAECAYVAPCVTPDALTALLAEAERRGRVNGMREAADIAHNAIHDAIYEINECSRVKQAVVSAISAAIVEEQKA